MSRKWEFRIGRVTVMPRKNHPGDFDPDLIDRDKLRDAINCAPEMARNAFFTMDNLKRGVLMGNDALEAKYALAKYFSIHPSDGGFKHYVEGITRVYFSIVKGLDVAYDIVVYDPTDKNTFSTGLGYVRPTRSTFQKGIQTADVSPIQKRLNIPEEWNHLEWNQKWSGFEDVGRIHISLALLFPDDPPADAVARTIVHEASHKFARTTDVLYKHQSFGKSAGNEGLLQATLTIEGKTITPMAGAVKGVTITPERYLENADSYAWTARRLWKRMP